MINRVIGVALGGTSEMTALAIVERPSGDDSPILVRHLERFAIGAAWSEVVDAVVALVKNNELSYSPIIVDYSSVGQPLITLLRAGVEHEVVPVTISAGLAINVAKGNHHVPKKELITFLQILLQNRRLRVARELFEATALAEELQNYRLKVPANKDPLEDWRSGPQDDLVFATVLACWWAERHPDPDATGVEVICTVRPHLRDLIGRHHGRIRRWS